MCYTAWYFECWLETGLVYIHSVSDKYRVALNYIFLCWSQTGLSNNIYWFWKGCTIFMWVQFVYLCTLFLDCVHTMYKYSNPDWIILQPSKELEPIVNLNLIWIRWCFNGKILSNFLLELTSRSWTSSVVKF